MRHLNQRKKKNALWNKAYTKPLIFSAGLGLLVGLMTYAVKSGLNDLANQELDRFGMEFSKNIGFKIDDIWVEGRENTPLADLKAVVNLELDQPMFQVDPNYLKGRIEALPWISKATVERQLPDILHIRLIEHRPIAIWQHNHTFSLINAQGKVILTGGEDINAFSHLPLVVGKGAPQYAKRILEIVQSEPKLNKDIKAIVRVSERRWDVVMNSETTIRLPEKLPEAAWTRLASYEANYSILEKGTKHIDLRLEDKILIKFDDLETIRKPLLGQNT